MEDAAEVYQICYSKDLLSKLEPGFNPIGDTSNPRPEWFEYWHIRQFLLNSPMEQNRFYGFFSPKFREKTNLSGLDIRTMAADNPECDVILFSPYLDQIAFFLNILEQGWFAHPALKSIFERLVKRHFPALDVETFVSTTENTVFCNFFIAKRHFWQRWLNICEHVFEDIESKKLSLGEESNFVTRYKGDVVPIQAFIIERIATLIIAADKNWKIVSAPSYKFSVGKMPFSGRSSHLLSLDSMKSKWVETKDLDYLKGFFDLRLDLLKQTLSPELISHPYGLLRFYQVYSDYLMKKLSFCSAG
jgi:hypothetical protein